MIQYRVISITCVISYIPVLSLDGWGVGFKDECADGLNDGLFDGFEVGFVVGILLGRPYDHIHHRRNNLKFNQFMEYLMIVV